MLGTRLQGADLVAPEPASLTGTTSDRTIAVRPRRPPSARPRPRERSGDVDPAVNFPPNNPAR